MPPLFGTEITTGAEMLAYMQDVAKADLYGITCFGKTDGGGAQAVAAMSVQLFCKLTNHSYFHTPFKRVRFAQDRLDWDAQWENFFNLGDGENAPPEGVPVLSTSEYIAQGRPAGVILAMPHCHNFIQNVHSPESYEILRNDFRKKYLAQRDPQIDQLIGDQDYMALHIRRGDVTASENNGRYTSSDSIVDTVQKFRDEINFHGPIHVFSQGNTEEFEFLNCFDDVQFFIDVDIFETMHRIVSAKAIVAAKSAVSYAAGLLSAAPVMTELWYHQPLDSWYRMSSSNFPCAHGFLAELKKYEAKANTMLAEQSEQGNRAIKDLVLGDDRFLKFSAKMKWVLAQVYLRELNNEAYVLLEELAASETPQSNAAEKTIASHIKMGLYYRAPAN